MLLLLLRGVGGCGACHSRGLTNGSAAMALGSAGDDGRGARLRVAPAARVAIEGGVALVRGCTAVEIDGAAASEIVDRLLDRAAAGATEEELVGAFPPELAQTVRALLEELRSRRLLLPADACNVGAESALDIFYWHFGLPDEPSPTPPSTEPVAVAGDGALEEAVAALLSDGGFDRLLRVPELPGASADARLAAAGIEAPALVVVGSETGFEPLREWNELCVATGVPFLPVAIQDLVAYVGPLVVSGQTACYECFLRRRYSNLEAAVARERIELRPDASSHVALHPAITAVAGGAAALEAAKFFLPWHTARQAGHLLTFNLLASTFGRHRVLKVPRCAVCGSVTRVQTTTESRGTMPVDVA
jgi:bacteriocin biosynthesis cyclodehydratase domain-containing protein